MKDIRLVLFLNARIFLGLLLLAACQNAFASELDDDWTAIQSLLSNIKGVAEKPPDGIVTNKFTTGMLMGNGDIGVVAGDTASTQKFYFSKGDFLGVFYNTAKTRWENSYLPIGSLLITSPKASTNPDAAYRMEQDILNAEVRTTMKLGDAVVNMRSWTADSENTFVTEFSTAPGSSPVTITAELQESVNEIFSYSCGVADGILWATRENDNRTDVKARVALVMKLIGAAFDSTTSGPASAAGSFTLKPGSSVKLVVTVNSDTKMKSECATTASVKDAAIRRAAEITSADISHLESNHKDWWKNYWLKSYLRVNDDVLEKYYYGSLYVLGSAARPGKTLPSMWGPWLTSDTPGWGGRHFFNYNAQAPYYGVASANRPELILPYSEFVMAELPYQINLTHAAGYKGTTFRRSYAPFDLFRPKPEILPVAAEKNYKKLQTDQKSNGGFGVVPLIMYYDYTKDKTFLKDKLYPFMKELDAFWRDFMEREELHGGGGYRYVVRHTGAHEVAVAEDVNPNLDLGYIRMVCRALIDGSRELGVDDELLPVWQDVLEHLSDYPTGEYDGKECYQECEVRNVGITDPARLMHRTDQPINMEGAVHPGENVTLGGDPNEIQIGLNTYQYMDAWGLSGRKMNNAFCKVWPQAVRLGWPADDFFNKFKASINSLWRESNLTCFQGGGGIETCGSIDAVNCMLLQSNFEQLRLFPVWPKDKDASFKRLRAKGAFLVSSELKDGKVAYIDITSEKGRRLEIKNPWSGPVDVFEINGGLRTRVPHSINGEFIILNTTEGKRYYLAPAAKGAQAIQSPQDQVPPADLTKIKPSDFAADELDLPYYIVNFHSVANSIALEGNLRGWIGASVWRGNRNQRTINARVLESQLSLAYFYCTKRPWNPYYGHPAVRARLEAMLERWCDMQSPKGEFSEYAEGRWGLAPTAFATKFMGESLRLLADGPPIDAKLYERVKEAQRKAIVATLTNPDFWMHGQSYANQFSNIWAGGLSWLARHSDDGEVRDMLMNRMKEAAAGLQSPAGYFYERDGSDWGYSLSTHHSNLQIAWHYARGTAFEPLILDEVRRYYDWLVWNAVIEPDGSGFVLNRAIETRQRRAWIGIDERPQNRNYSSVPQAEAVESARAFLPNRQEQAAELARQRAELEKQWPNLPEMQEGSMRSYSPYAFLHRSMVHWLPTAGQQAESRAKLPYIPDGRYAHLRADNRHEVYYLYVRRPNYYVAFNAGEQLSPNQRYGLGLLWAPAVGTLAQSQTGSNDNLWGTKPFGQDAPYEAGDLKAKIEVGGKEIKPQPGAKDLGSGDVTVGYALGATGRKTINFGDDRISIKIEHPGNFFESVPLMTREDDRLRIDKNMVLLQRNERAALTIEFDPAASAELLDKSGSIGPYRVATARIKSKDKLSYSVLIAPDKSAGKQAAAGPAIQ